jgi:hypothetical protein
MDAAADQTPRGLACCCRVDGVEWAGHVSANSAVLLSLSSKCMSPCGRNNFT